MIQSLCNACGKPLLIANLLVCDGCPCNSANGVNFPPRACGHCRTDDCTRPGHRLELLFGDLSVGVESSLAIAMLRDALARAESAVIALRAQNAQLWSSLDTYARHYPSCPKSTGCTCGFEAARDACGKRGT